MYRQKVAERVLWRVFPCCYYSGDSWQKTISINSIEINYWMRRVKERTRELEMNRDALQRAWQRA